MIDLHSHTNESDGTCSPAQLIEEAVRAGVTTLGITDHDTFKGYDQAVPLARGAGRGTGLRHRAVHQAARPFGAPAGLFSATAAAWAISAPGSLDQQAARRDRNIRLVARLQELGFDITLEEAEARGRGMTGRPHFAQILVEKGYVANLRQAFDDYLDESAKGYVYPPRAAVRGGSASGSARPAGSHRWRIRCA